MKQLLLRAEEKRKLAKQVQDHLDSSPEVRPFPAAVTRLLAACQDSKATAATFESIIECDPALSIRLLRLVNSPLFGLTDKVKDIAHAVVLVGNTRLKTLAMSVAGASMFTGSDEAQQYRTSLWNHSVGCAVVAQQLGKKVPGVHTDNAFLSGIFHDVGKLLFYDIAPKEYSELSRACNHEQLIGEEAFIFGKTHEEIGLQSSHSWDLPNEIKYAIGWHHRPTEAPGFEEHTTLIGIADQLAHHWGIGSDIDETEDLETTLIEKYELSDEYLEELKATVEEQYAETIKGS